MRRGRPPYPDVLTPREQEVLALIRDGLTNEQIAARLGISESGARYHVSEILSKLGVASRYEAAQWHHPRSVFAWLIGSASSRAGVLALYVVCIGLIALGVGVIVMDQRTSAGGDTRAEADPRFNEELDEELRGLALLAADARSRASARIADPVLHHVTIDWPSRRHEFLFFADSGGLPSLRMPTYVSQRSSGDPPSSWLIGPSPALWPTGGPTEAAGLDLSSLRLAPTEAATLMISRFPGIELMTMTLVTMDDAMFWTIFGRTGAGVYVCTASNMTLRLAPTFDGFQAQPECLGPAQLP